MSRVFRLVSWLVLLVLALVSLSVIVPSAASAAPRTPECTRTKHHARHHARHSVAKALHRSGQRAAVREDARPDTRPSFDVDLDDDDDDDDDGAPDPDALGPTSLWAVAGPTERPDTGFGGCSTGRATPGTRHLPDDPP